MTEGFSFNNDVMFAFEQVALSSQKKATLTDDEQRALKKMPKAKRAKQKEELLKKAEEKKKAYLFLMIRELETKIEESDLPSEVKSKMLEMTQYAKSHDMNFFYDVQHQIKQMKAEVAAAKAQEKNAETKQAEKMAAAAVGVVIAGAAIAPFIQVRYTKEEFEKRTTEYYNNKIVDELVAGKTEMTPPQIEHPKKQGSVYSKRHYQVADKHKTEVQDLIVAQIQEKQKKAGIPVQTADKIIDNLTHMHPVKQRAAERAIYIEHPELKKQHDIEDKQVSSEEILRRLVRDQRKSEEKTILALQKEQASLQKEGTKTALHQAAQLDKKIKARQETAASLDLFVEHFDTVMQANETTAGDLIKAGTTDGKVLIGAIVDQITSLDMTGFAAKEYETAEKVETKGLAKTLADHSAPIKAKEKAPKKAEMRLVKAEQKGLSKHLKDAVEKAWDKEDVKEAVREAAKKAGQTPEKAETPKQVKEAWAKIEQKMTQTPTQTTAKAKKPIDKQILTNLAENYRQAG